MISEAEDLSVSTMESEKNSNVQSKKRCFSQTSYLSYPEEAEHMPVREVAAGAKHSGLGQACTASVSELKLSEESLPYLNWSLDADIEMYCKEREGMCCAQVDESTKEADVLGKAYGDRHLYSEVCGDDGQSYLNEDSQLEYLSAHEQDFSDIDSSSEFSEQRKDVGTKTLKQMDPVHEIPGCGVAKEQSLPDVSEDSLAASDFGVSVCTCAEATTSELHHVLHECSDMICDCQGEQMAYHSAVNGSMLESHSCGSEKGVCPNLFVCDSSENGKVKDIPLTDGTQPLQTAAGEVAEHSDLHVHSSSVRRDSPSQSLRKRVLAEAVQFHCGFCGCKKPGVCTCGSSCTDRTTKDAESQFPVSEIVTAKVLSFGVEAAGDSSCLNSEHRENLKNITSNSTIDQAVDAGSNIQVCFTTSRSISAQACLSSRAINTQPTMMNKCQPVEWSCETRADIVCNKDRSCGAGSTQETQSQPTDTVERHLDGDTATAGRSSQMNIQGELCSSDLKISTDRLLHLDKQAVKQTAPSCCQKILQRAIEAELQLLNAHYKMCHQHCLKIYKLALEENTCFHRLVLEELKKNYSSLRLKIKSGTPLNALPPLSVEIKLFPISSSYVPCELFREDLHWDSVSDARKADFKAPKQQERGISANVAGPQTVCSLTDGHQPSDSASTKTSAEQHRDQNVECGCVKNEERNGDLTVADSSVISEETKKQPEKQDRVDLREVKRMETGSEGSLFCAGGLSSSVTEGDSRSRFQKYQIANVLNFVDSANYRDVIPRSKEMNQAQLAAEEMNRKEIKGETTSVELVNNSSENKSSVSQILKAKHGCETQPVNNSQRKDQDEALASASSTVKALSAASASEKAHLHPLTSSNVSSSTQVRSETKCPGLKSPTEDSDTGETFQQKTPAPFSTSSCDAFISPNTLNLSSFTKLMKKLQEIHPAASRDKIVAALLEVKKNNKGVLSGLSISSITERTSAILKKSTPSCVGEKERK